MITRQRRFVLLCGLAPTLVAAVLSVWPAPFLARSEFAAYDTFLRALPARAPRRVVIVDVDERSLSAIGQWPWRRDVMAQLVDRLRGLGAATIALDIIFAESDRQEPSGPAGDEALAASVGVGRVVLGYALTFDGHTGIDSACAPPTLNIALVQRRLGRADDPFFRATGAVCSLPILARASSAAGFLNVAPDSDGRLRRVPLLMTFEGRVVPSLALAAVASTLETHEAVLRLANVNASTLQFNDRNVPVDGKSNLLIHFRGPRHTVQYVSAADVLSGDATAESFADKVVFVGTTAVGARDVVTTPVDTLFTGVEVQATVADELLQQDFLRVPESAPLISLLAVLLVGGVVTVSVAWAGLLWGAVVAVLTIVVTWVSPYGVMTSMGAYLSPVMPTLAAASAYVATVVAHLRLERRRADREGRDRVVSQHLMVQGLLSLTEVRDAETGRHSRRTRQYARVIAEQLAKRPAFTEYFTPDRIALLETLAPLHDIGKVGVPDRLLNKPGALTVDELVEMRRHPEHGRDVIVRAERDVGVPDDLLLAMMKDIVYTHHEKWDGSGYPRGLRGTAIPVAGRLMALVDVYDAITTRRTYRDPMTHDEAVAFIASGRGSHFDPEMVDAFVEIAPRISQILATELRILEMQRQSERAMPSDGPPGPA